VGRWKQSDLVAEGLELTSPVVGGATGFHKNVGGGMMQEESPKASAGEPMLLVDPTGSMGHGNLED
jgi:hypothetical protein